MTHEAKCLDQNLICVITYVLMASILLLMMFNIRLDFDLNFVKGYMLSKLMLRFGFQHFYFASGTRRLQVDEFRIIPKMTMMMLNMFQIQWCYCVCKMKLKIIHPDKIYKLLLNIYILSWDLTPSENNSTFISLGFLLL